MAERSPGLRSYFSVSTALVRVSNHDCHSPVAQRMPDGTDGSIIGHRALRSPFIGAHCWFLSHSFDLATTIAQPPPSLVTAALHLAAPPPRRRWSLLSSAGRRSRSLPLPHATLPHCHGLDREPAASRMEEIQRKPRVREWTPQNAPRIRAGATKKVQKAELKKNQTRRRYVEKNSIFSRRPADTRQARGAKPPK